MNTLQQAVIDQLGCDEDELLGTCQDISSHGIDGGFGAFIYYSDTIAFAEANKDDILQLARDMAEECGFDGAYSLIATFRCLGDGYTSDSVADAINNKDHDDYTQVMNALAWFAAEEVSRGICDE
jgi:hypothetical protein